MGRVLPTYQEDQELLLSTRGLTKTFGDLVANEALDLDIRKGEIHALLGENGAGKSTLVKMLYGSLQPDSGSIMWRGKETSIANPAAARNLGIGMVFQHFSLFEALTVADNILISTDNPVSRQRVAHDAERLAEAYGLPLNTRSYVGDLSVGERQRVEIVRCLLQDPQLIILDEPTSVLTPQEAEGLFETLLRLRAEGRSVLYISHRLEEVKALCDRATVLRHGKKIGECDPAQETAASLAAMMVGAQVEKVERDHDGALAATCEVHLELSDASLEPESPFAVRLRNLDLQVRSGEIVGIAGVAGNGQSELFRLISGEVSAPRDQIKIRGQQAGGLSVNGRRRLGAAFVPEERLGHGAVPDMTLSENLLLSRHASDRVAFQRFGPLGVVWKSMLTEAMKRICNAMDVRKSTADPAASALSGGNLQKFIIGRELDRQPSILVVNQPTWGVDAGAAQRIRKALVDLAKTGSAILMISQDLDEIFEIADRILVIDDGSLREAGAASKVTRKEVGIFMGGATAGMTTSTPSSEENHAH
jgi:ABC-type uncharacterized transport system ATPase subunit